MSLSQPSETPLFSVPPYVRQAQYHETDQMGVIHHANYLKWLEEARIDFLAECGVSYGAMEAEGIVSPIAEVTCRYRQPVRFGDSVQITLWVKRYTGVRLTLGYAVAREDGTVLCAEAETVSCFMNRDGRLISLKKECPALHALLEKISQHHQTDVSEA